MTNKNYEKLLQKLIQAAGYQDIHHLASALVLNVPAGASIPLGDDHIILCAGSIHDVMVSRINIVDEDGKLSSLASEIATLLNEDPRSLFEELSTYEKDLEVADYDNPLMVEDMSVIQRKFTVGEWAVLQAVYIDGMSLTDTALALKRAKFDLNATLQTIDRKLKNLAREGMVFHFTADPSECFFGERSLRHEKIQREWMAAEFRRVAVQGHSPVEMTRARNALMTHALKHDGLPFFQVEVTGLINIIHGVSHIDKIPPANLMIAWRNGFSLKQTSFMSSQLQEVRGVLSEIQSRLTSPSSPVDTGAYDQGHDRTTDKAMVHLAMTEVMLEIGRRPY